MRNCEVNKPSFNSTVANTSDKVSRLHQLTLGGICGLQTAFPHREEDESACRKTQWWAVVFLNTRVGSRRALASAVTKRQMQLFIWWHSKLQYLSLLRSLSDIGGENTAGTGAGSRLVDSSIRLSIKSLTCVSNWRIRSLFKYWATEKDTEIVIKLQNIESLCQ